MRKITHLELCSVVKGIKCETQIKNTRVLAKLDALGILRNCMLSNYSYRMIMRV